MAIDYLEMMRRQRERALETAAQRSRTATVLYAETGSVKPKKQASVAKKSKGLTKSRKRGHLGSSAVRGEPNAPTNTRDPRMAAKKKAAKKSAKKAAKKSAPKKAPKKSTKRAAPKSAPKKAPRKSSAKKKWGSPAQKAAIDKARRKRLSNLKKHPRKKHPVKAYSYKRPAKNIHVPAHQSREEASRRARKAARTRRANEMAAMEARKRRGHGSKRRRRHVYDNPLTGLELGAVIVTGVIGFTGADLVDRFIATRSGPFAGTAMATQQPLFSDWKRPAAGVGITVVPLVAAHFIKSPFWRSALQGIGVGAGLNVAGKAINALAGIALKDTTFGQRLYAPETKMHDAMVEVQAQQKKQVQAQQKKQGAAGVPAGAGKPAGLGTDVVAAGEAIRANAPAMRALVEHQSAFEAVRAGRATGEQRAEVAAVNQKFASSFVELQRHAPETLDKAIKTYGTEQLGLAGAPKPAAAPAPLAKKVDAPFVDVDKYNWAA